MNGGIRDLETCENLIYANRGVLNESNCSNLYSDDVSRDRLLDEVRESCIEEGGENKKIRVLDSVMMGRAALTNVCLFGDVDRRFYGKKNPDTALNRKNILNGYISYLDAKYPNTPEKIGAVFKLVSPVFGVLGGQPGNRQFRQCLDQQMKNKKELKPPADIIKTAMKTIEESFGGIWDMPLYNGNIMNKYNHLDKEEKDKWKEKKKKYPTGI